MAFIRWLDPLRSIVTCVNSTRWDDLLRVAASVHGGHATAALVVGKLCSSKRQQSTLAAAMKEYGLLCRTLYAVRYLSDKSYRRRIGRQLNKGENLHSLRRALAYAHEGALRRGVEGFGPGSGVSEYFSWSVGPAWG
jgi:TnpA family transposase